MADAAPATDAYAAVFRYLAKGLADAQANAPAQPDGKGKKRALDAPVLNVSETALTEREAVLTFLGVAEEAKRLTSEDAGRCVELIRQHRLVREHVPSELLGSVPVWSALLEQRPARRVSLARTNFLDFFKSERSMSVLSSPSKVDVEEK